MFGDHLSSTSSSGGPLSTTSSKSLLTGAVLVPPRPLMGAGASSTSSAGSGSCALSPPPNNRLSTKGNGDPKTSIEEHDEDLFIVFARGHKAAQRCLQLIKMLAILKTDSEENHGCILFQTQSAGFTYDGGLRADSAGWNLDGLRAIAGVEDSERKIVDDCMARLESERTVRFGMMAPLIFGGASTDEGKRKRVGASSLFSGSSVEGVLPERDDSDGRRSLRAIAEDAATTSSRFVTEFDLFKRSMSSVGAGVLAEVVSGDCEDEKIRPAGPGFSSTLFIAFLGLGERIERSLRLLARRVNEVDDLPLQIVVTSMNGDDLLKHDTTVFLSSGGDTAQNRATIADVKELVRKNVRKDSEQEREAMDAEEQRLAGALGKEFWAAVGGWDDDVPGSAELRKRLPDGFQEVIFNEPVRTLECGRGHLALVVGFHLTVRREEDGARPLSGPRQLQELRVEPVLYFLPSSSAEVGQEQIRSLYWCGKQLLNFVRGEQAENGWHNAQFHPGGDCDGSVPPVFVHLRGGAESECGSTKPTWLVFDGGVEAATTAHAKLACLASAKEQPVITLSKKNDHITTLFQHDVWTLLQLRDGVRRRSWLKQSGVSKLKGYTSGRSRSEELCPSSSSTVKATGAETAGSPLKGSNIARITCVPTPNLAVPICPRQSWLRPRNWPNFVSEAES